MKLLCIADVHLGRYPSRLHEGLAEQAAQLGPAEAWNRAVDLAVREEVDAVLLAGDLVDGGNDFFEAFADLVNGVERLTRLGVEVLAVAGNHDVSVLPRLVDAVPQVRLLGAGGRWEAADLAAPFGAVRVVGWSWPERWVEGSPLGGEGLAAAAGAGGEPPALTLGLLHADRDQPGSRYAPVTSAELGRAPVDAWLLGHVHRPDFAAAVAAGGPAWSGYLGSLTANDPGEAGARGAWLLELAPGRVEARHVALAPLRWEMLEVDVNGLESAELLPGLIVDGLRALRARLHAEGASPAAVGCRLTLVGRTRVRGRLEAQLAADDPVDRTYELDGVTFFIDRVRSRARPLVDLEALAGANDPLGLLAARLVALREPASPLRARLIERSRPRLEELRRSAPFVGIEPGELGEEEIVALLEEAALNALDALLDQQAPGAAGGGRA